MAWHTETALAVWTALPFSPNDRHWLAGTEWEHVKRSIEAATLSMSIRQQLVYSTEFRDHKQIETTAWNDNVLGLGLQHNRTRVDA